MRRLALTLTLLGVCAITGACDGSRAITEPASRLHNGGTIGSGHRGGTEVDNLTARTQDNGGTSGSGHREGVDGGGSGGAATQSTGTSGTGPDDEIKLENGGTSGSGH